MRIAVGSDHAGFALKLEMVRHLQREGHEVIDFGCFGEESVDYPDYALPVAERVASGQADRGLLVCGTGQGMGLAANKVRGMRAVVCHDTFSARMTRLHNDALILCLGARVVGPGLAADLVDIFLATEFEGGRHQRRVEKIRRLEFAT